MSSSWTRLAPERPSGWSAAAPANPAGLALVMVTCTSPTLAWPPPISWMESKTMSDASENAALRRIVKWACDTEDVDFFTRDNPADVEAISLIYGIVISPAGRDGHR